ncbi:hypothetical protein L6452_34852 [Arctium lappa]|uniref:Uncharacterized protein n=1 Tax=Arctium lappa TaxID=4217 RepID=A0ACB8YK15_ARCLA|nr:hypothetical protein L6452_34852 [Arctium lappa]
MLLQFTYSNLMDQHAAELDKPIYYDIRVSNITYKHVIVIQEFNYSHLLLPLSSSFSIHPSRQKPYKYPLHLLPINSHSTSFFLICRSSIFYLSY